MCKHNKYKIVQIKAASFSWLQFCKQYQHQGGSGSPSCLERHSLDPLTWPRGPHFESNHHHNFFLFIVLHLSFIKISMSLKIIKLLTSQCPPPPHTHTPTHTLGWQSLTHFYALTWCPFHGMSNTAWGNSLLSKLIYKGTFI